MNFIIYIIILAILESIAMFFLKFYNVENNIVYLLVGSSIYFIIGIAFAYALEFNFIVNVTVYWNVFSTIFAVLIGLLFSEFLTLTNIVGIIISLVGVYIMNL